MTALPLTLAASAVLWVAAVAGTPPLSRGSGGRAPVALTQELPDGPGKKLVSTLCAGCHDLMFTVSTRETKDGWTRIVNDMRGKGADGADKDFDDVITYLATHFGKPEPAASVR